MPALDEFYHNYSSEVNLISVGGSSLSGNKDNLTTIQEFASEHNASWTYLYDEDEILKSSFSLSAYPSWILLEGHLDSGQDQIVHKSSGTKSYD